MIVHNSLQYRTSPRKLRSKARVEYDIPLEMPEAQRIHRTYQRSYPGVPRYWSTQIDLVKELGYVETFGGSRVNVIGDWSGRDSWSMGSTAINTRIQGTGADQKYLAISLGGTHEVMIFRTDKKTLPWLSNSSRDLLPPELLKDPHCPVIGLTIDPKSLIDIRRHRLQLIGAGAQPGFAQKDNGEYVDFESVEKELLWAKRLCNTRGWPTIDVTRRSIEETAATILKLMDNWHAKHGKAPE